MSESLIVARVNIARLEFIPCAQPLCPHTPLNLIRICDKRIEPVMTGLTPITPNARQDLIDLLQFKEWYAKDDVTKIEPIGAILKRYPIQALRDTINTLPMPPPARYQRRHPLTTYGPYAF